MPLSHTGNIIKDIKTLKTKTVITFASLDKLEISNDTATSVLLYKDKVLSLSEINKIKETDELNKYISQALKILRTSLISEYNLKQKLIKKGASESIALKTIKILKSNDLINDEGLILDFIEYGNEVLYGENKIKQKLYLKGIPTARINKIKFNQANELKKAKEVVKMLNKSNAKLSYAIKKQKFYNSLLTKGFNSEVALKALLGLKVDKDDALISQEIKSLMSRWLKQNKDKYSQNKDTFIALAKFLRNKGYPYNKIKQIWEENYEYLD